MAVYEVFSQTVSYRYKTTLCSKATIVLVVLTFLAVILPLIISYKSNGFWLKTEFYQEQPNVKFTHDYLLLLQTNTPHAPIECRAQNGLVDRFQRHCLFKSHEADVNHDGKVDRINVDIKVPLLANESVYSVTLLLSLDFHISSVCQLRMLSLAPIQYTSALPGASLDVAAELRFMQKKPVDYRSKETLFTSPLFPEDGSLQDLFLSYSLRNFSTSLSNRFDVWSTGHEEGRPFLLTLHLTVPENKIVYRPGFWQVMKWAWMQYLSIFLIFVYFLNMLKEYIFSNQLVPTYRFIPWKHALC